jgi:hypothetical protein
VLPVFSPQLLVYIGIYNSGGSTVSKGFFSRVIGSLLFVLLVILATPRPAKAYVDPGSGSMLWQATAAACIGSLFYLRRVALWARKSVGLRSPRALGFVFATSYALIASPVICSLYQYKQLPRFGDIFLLGIVLTVYFFTWEAAAYLLIVAVMVSAWILPPFGSLVVTGTANWYRLGSFTAISLFLICLVARVKTRHSSSATHRNAMTVHQAAMGTD